MISYAGQVLRDSSLLAPWLAAMMPPEAIFEHYRFQWLGDANFDPRNHLDWFLARGTKLNTLFNPWGASRWGQAYVVVGKPALEKIRLKTYHQATPAAPPVYTACPFVMDADNGKKITTDLFMLPPIPLTGAPLSDKDVAVEQYLLPLVDERFLWWEKAAEVTVVEGTTTWQGLIESILITLGVIGGTPSAWSDVTDYVEGDVATRSSTVYFCVQAHKDKDPSVTRNSSYWQPLIDPIQAAYLKPAAGFGKDYEYLPLLLDAAAESCGLRMSRRLDGTFYFMNARNALAIAQDNDDAFTKIGGGSLPLASDTQANVPSQVVVIYPRADSGVMGPNVYPVTKTLAALSLTEYASKHGHVGDKLYHSTVIANFDATGTLTNSAELTALAGQIATDFYLWRLAYLEAKYRMPCDWSAEAMHDVEWLHGTGIATAVHRSKWMPDFSIFRQSGTNGSSDTAPTTDSPGIPVTASFVIPAIGSTVSVDITSTSALYVNQLVKITDGARIVYGYVVSITDGDTFVFKTSYVAVGAAGNTILAGAIISFCCKPVFSSLTSATFVIPAFLTAVTVTVDSTTWMQSNMEVSISDTTNVIYGIITVINGTSFTFYPTKIEAGAAGNTVTTQATILPISTPLKTPTTATFTLPAVGSPVTVSMGSTAWMQSGQEYLIYDGANFVYGWLTPINATSATFVPTLYTGGAPTNTMGIKATIIPMKAPTELPTTASFTLPAVGTGVTVNVLKTDLYKNNDIVRIYDGTNDVDGWITIINTTSFTFTPRYFYGGTATSTMLTRAKVVKCCTGLSPLLGKPSLPTNATVGFPQFALMSGIPTGTPSPVFTGFVPIATNTLDAGLWYYDSAWYSLTGGKKSSNIASGSTTDLSTATGDFVHITGTTTITALGTAAAGIRKVLIFDGSLTLTYNATSLILPSAANIVTAANDVAIAISEGSGNWRVVDFQRADGTALVSSGGTPTEGTLVATGNNQGNAAAITTTAVAVSGADGTKGVILPNTPGTVSLQNTDSLNSLKIYPNSGAQINGSGANNPYTLGGSGKILFCRMSSTQWDYVVLT